MSRKQAPVRNPLQLFLRSLGARPGANGTIVKLFQDGELGITKSVITDPGTESETTIIHLAQMQDKAFTFNSSTPIHERLHVYGQIADELRKDPTCAAILDVRSAGVQDARKHLPEMERTSAS